MEQHTHQSRGHSILFLQMVDYGLDRECLSTLGVDEKIQCQRRRSGLLYEVIDRMVLDLVLQPARQQKYMNHTVTYRGWLPLLVMAPRTFKLACGHQQGIGKYASELMS